VPGRFFRRSGGCSDIAGIELPPPARKTIDLEGRLVKDGVELHEAQEDLEQIRANKFEAKRRCVLLRRGKLELNEER